MANFTIKFLDNKYSFPEELKIYADYRSNFQDILENLITSFTEILSLPIWKKNEKDDTQIKHLDETMKFKMRVESKKVISMLAQHNIFDITEKDLVDFNTGYANYIDVYEKCDKALLKILSNEITRFTNTYESIQRQAQSKITGTGVTIYTSSMFNLMAYSLLDGAITINQTNEAKKEIQRNLETLNNTIDNNIDRKSIETMALLYPEFVSSIGTYVFEMMNIFFDKLERAGIFNYSKVKGYNIDRSSDILENLSVVEDKKSLLATAFNICPYNAKVFIKAYEILGLNEDDIITIKKLKLNKMLFNHFISLVEKENNLSYINIAAKLHDKSEKDIICNLYANELEDIYKKYSRWINSIEYQDSLKLWINECLDEDLEKLAYTDKKTLREYVKKDMNTVVSSKHYKIIANYDAIELKDTNNILEKSNNINTINANIENLLTEALWDYLQIKKADFDKIKEEKKNQIAKAVESAKKSKMITTIVIAISLVAIIAFIIIYPKAQFNKALQKIESEDYATALNIFVKLKKEDEYNNIIFQKVLDLNEEMAYEEALELTNHITNYEIVEDVVKELKYNIANIYMEEKLYEEAVAIFEELSNYNNTLDLINEAKYCIANETLLEGDLQNAYLNFLDIKRYKDSEEKMVEIQKNILSQSKVGDVIKFGTYNNEAIKWNIIDKKGSEVLLLSTNGIEPIKYQNSRDDASARKSSTAWQNSNARKWANDTFLRRAFTESEREIISLKQVSSTRNTKYGTTSGNSTLDKVFFLSVEEVEKYNINNITQYSWWSRTPGNKEMYTVASIDPLKQVTICDPNNIDLRGTEAYEKHDSIKARPAMWVKFS